jgi:YegS/Rv2252/BmrU family lipid kinase
VIHTPATREGRFAVAVAAVLPFAILTALVVAGWGPLERLDESIADSMASYGESRPGWVDFWRGLGAVVLPWAWRALLVVVAGYLWRRRARMLAVWLVTTAALELAAVQAVKYAVDREPPVDGLIDITSPAYVSGHATAAAVMAGAVLVVLPAVRGWSVRAKVAAWSAAVLVVLVTSADRIFLNVQYVSDVVGGWALGAALVTATTAGFALRPRSRARSRPNGTGDEAETPPRAAVIVNPVKVGDGPAFRRKVTKALGSRGFSEPLWLETTESDSGHAMAKRAVVEEVDLVLVAGGDGTVRVVCAQLARTGIPVAVVPAGTGNLLARNLGIPMDLDDALYRLLDGRDRTIDLVEVHGDELDTDRFAVMAGLGLDAAIIDDAPADLKKRIGWPAYVVSAMKNINHPSVRVEITLDDQDPIERKARTVVIGNVGNLQANIPLLPDAVPDDGTIDVIVIAPRRVTQWPRLIVRVLTRRRRSDPYLERFTGERVAITAAVDVRRQLDGDAIGSGRTIVAQVEPGALVVRVPD